MADPVPTTVVTPPGVVPQVVTPPVSTNPLAPGTQTTEFYIAKIVTALSGVSAVLGFALDLAAKLQGVMPMAPWLNNILVIGGIVGACVSQLIYTLSRVSIKKAALVFQPGSMVVPPGSGTIQQKAVDTLNG